MYTVCGGIERPNSLCHTDKEQIKEGITEIEQTRKI